MAEAVRIYAIDGPQAWRCMCGWHANCPTCKAEGNGLTDVEWDAFRRKHEACHRRPTASED